MCEFIFITTIYKWFIFLLVNHSRISRVSEWIELHYLQQECQTLRLRVWHVWSMEIWLQDEGQASCLTLLAATWDLAIIRFWVYPRISEGARQISTCSWHYPFITWTHTPTCFFYYLPKVRVVVGNERGFRVFRSWTLSNLMFPLLQNEKENLYLTAW